MYFEKSWDKTLTPEQRAVVERACTDADAGVTDGLVELSSLGRRLLLRVPSDHALSTALMTALGEIKVGHDEYKDAARDPVDRRTAMSRHAQAALSSFKDFGNEVRSLFAQEPA